MFFILYRFITFWEEDMQQAGGRPRETGTTGETPRMKITYPATKKTHHSDVFS